MEDRKNKTALMLLHKIEWQEVQDMLDVSRPTIFAWRHSGDPNKNEVIDMAISKLVENKEKSKLNTNGF